MHFKILTADWPNPQPCFRGGGIRRPKPGGDIKLDAGDKTLGKPHGTHSHGDVATSHSAQD